MKNKKHVENNQEIFTSSKRNNFGDEIIDASLSRREIEAEKLILNTDIKSSKDIVDIVKDEKKLEIFNERIRKMKTSFASSRILFGSDIEAGALQKNIEKIIDETTTLDSKTGIYKTKSYLEIVKNNWQNRTSLWGFLKNTLKHFFARNYVSRFEKEINIYKKAQEIGGKAKTKVGEFADAVKNIEKPKKKFMSLRRRIKTIKTARSEREVEILSKRWKRKMSGFIFGSQKIAPDKLAQNIQKESREILKQGGRHGTNFTDAVAKKKFPGLTIGTAGKFITVEVLSRSIIRAIEEKKFQPFFDNISNSNLWIEAIPGVGTYRSGRRMFLDNGDPMWAKGLDLGLNVLGDGILAFGVANSAITFGTSGAAGIAARGGILAVGRKFIQRSLTKQGLKNLAVKTGKTTLSTGKWTIGATALGLALNKTIEILKKKFPRKRIAEMGESIAIDQLSEQQKELYNLGKETVLSVTN